MADNVTLPGTGIPVRTIAKTANSGAQTQAILIDVGGGADGSPEVILVAGQQLAAASIPVVLTAAQMTTLTPLSAVQANAGTNLNTSLLALEGGGHLASVDAKLPALGQALAAASVPVVLTAAQLTTLAPLATVAATQSGTWTVGISAAQTIAVTNTGTFAVQAALNAETTKVIGTVNIAAAQTVGLAAGTQVIGHVIVDSGTITTVTTVSAVTAITNALPAGGNVIGLVKTNASRGTQVLHRSAITGVDLITQPSTTVAPTVADVTTAGTLAPATTYRAAYAVSNTQGVTIATAVASQLTANDGNSTHAIRLTIPQATVPGGGAVPGATTYDIFMSVDTAPKWVGRITETQRAAGGTTITAVGTVGSGGPGGAGTVDIRVPGTGQQTSAQNFQANTAYVTASLTPYNAAGFSRLRCQVQVTLTDLRTIPTLTIVPVWLNDLNANQYHMGAPLQLPLCSGSGAALQQDFILEADGSDSVIILIDTLTGQGASVSIWLQPV